MQYLASTRPFFLGILCLIGTLPITDVAREEFHAIHMSVCEITYNADTHGLEMTFKLFTDDLDQAMKTEGAGKLYLGEKNEREETDRYLTHYLEKNLKIEVNGKTVVWRYLGKEVEADVLWLFAEANEIPPLKTVSVTNTLLIETFDDQANMVHITTGKQKKSLLLTLTKPSDSVAF